MTREWRNIIEAAYAPAQDRFRAAFRGPASEADMSAVEKALKVALPVELRELLSFSNGIAEQQNFRGTFDDVRWIVWPCDELVRANKAKRRGDPSGFCKRYLFFSGNASTSDYALPLDPDAPRSVIRWYPVEDEIEPLAESVEEMFELMAKREA
jgi:cell wall assembly regulator SMI1